ncbi:unnamed protein product [Mesocestoides corti]|uniref:DUF1794 domain-containing protein n=1 Tax=Mesocestoides corti TaxID=53468 RepID=A0A0R3U9W4_MESCO|nr:unnamed protein product [Mesocestoides corti]
MRDLSFMIGEWRGVGKGILPHGPAFQYEEDLVVENIGQPNFAYSATSYINGDPKHRESGFIKCHENGQVVFCLADNLGTCTVLLGSLTTDGEKSKTLILTSDTTCRAPSNKEPYVIEVSQ